MKTAGVAKYQTIKSLLAARLERECAPGDKIDSAVDLARVFGVSRMTVEQALKLLENEGVIRREQGRGTFYIDGKPARTEAPIIGLLETVFKQRPGAHIRVLRKSTCSAPARVRARLQLKPGGDVVEILRVGILDNEPIVLITMWLVPALGAKLLKGDFTGKDTIMSFLAKRGLRLGPIRQQIRACLADPSIAPDLGIQVGEPLLEAQRTYFDQTKKPVAYSEAFYRSDRYSFEVSLKE